MARVLDMRTPLHPAGVDADDTESVLEVLTEPGVIARFGSCLIDRQGYIIDPQGTRVELSPTDETGKVETLNRDQDLLDHGVFGDLDSVSVHGVSAMLANGLQLPGNHIFFLA